MSKIKGNGEEVDTKTCGVEGKEVVQINPAPSEYDLEELKVIYDALGQIPVALAGEAIIKLSALRDKIKNDFEIKQKNMNK